MSGEPRKLTKAQQIRLAANVGANQTLADLVNERVGGTKAHKVLSFIGIYGVFVEQHGYEPRSISELARAGTSSRSSATIDRYGAAFREAFPEYDMPTVLWYIAREAMPHLNVENEEVLGMQLGATPL